MTDNEKISELELDFKVNVGNSARTINNMSKALDNLAQASERIKQAGGIDEVVDACNRLQDKLAETRKPKDKSTTYTQTINGVTRLQRSYERLNGAVTQNTIKYDENGKMIEQTTKKIDENGNTVVTTTKKVNDLMKKVNFGVTLGKIYFFINYTKRIAQGIAKMVQRGIDFQETLNLWQTSMRENTAQAREFVREMNRAYGVAEETLMRYQATFNNMLSALGNINRSIAYDLSESLTQMALDYASLYNTSIESAMTKFQAVLAGTVRPIREQSGYDITEDTIYQMYQDLGGTKTQRALSQTEKRLLRIYAVYQQMAESGARGDLAKTISSNSNQLRIASETLKEISTWLGTIISGFIKESGILVKLNTHMIVFREILKSIAYTYGYRETAYEMVFEDIDESATDAEESVEKLKKSLAGFDKFQVLSTSTQTEDTDISKIITDALKNYQNLYKEIDNPSYNEAVKILENMGMKLKTITDETTGATEQFYELGGSVKAALGMLSAFSTVLFVMIDIKLLNKIVSAFKDITKLVSGLPKIFSLIKLHPVLAIVTAIAAMFGHMYAINEDFRESVNRLFSSLGKLFESILEPLIDGLSQVFTLISNIIDFIAPLFTAINNGLSYLIDNIVLPFNERRKSNFIMGSSQSQSDANARITSGTLNLESSIALATATGVGMSQPSSQDITVNVDGQRLFSIFADVAARNGYSLVRAN